MVTPGPGRPRGALQKRRQTAGHTDARGLVRQQQRKLQGYQERVSRPRTGSDGGTGLCLGGFSSPYCTFKPHQLKAARPLIPTGRALWFLSTLKIREVRACSALLGKKKRGITRAGVADVGEVCRLREEPQAEAPPARMHVSVPLWAPPGCPGDTRPGVSPAHTSK